MSGPDRKDVFAPRQSENPVLYVTFVQDTGFFKVHRSELPDYTRLIRGRSTDLRS